MNKLAEYTYNHIHTHTFMCLSICIISVLMYAFSSCIRWLHIHVYTCVRMCIYICIVWIYIYIYTCIECSSCITFRCGGRTAPGRYSVHLAEELAAYLTKYLHTSRTCRVHAVVTLFQTVTH